MRGFAQMHRNFAAERYVGAKRLQL